MKLENETTHQESSEESRPSILYCPMGRPFEPCDPAELEPIRVHLSTNDAPSDPMAFPRGTHLPDGRLDLCKQRIGPEGIAKIEQAVASNERTQHLLLGANGLRDEGAASVANIASQNPRLRTVYLGCNHIEKGGVEQLANALKHNTQVTGLWLKRNPLGPQGVGFIADMLAENQSIRTLDLVHTWMGSEGLARIVDVLCTRNRSVRRLYLGGNELRARDAELLCRLLTENAQIHSLFLGVNRLGDAGLRLLQSGLQVNSALRSLSLSCNRIGPEGAWHLAEALEGNSTLRVLDLGYDKSAPVLGEQTNAIGDAGMPAIAELIATTQLEQLDLRMNGISNLGGQVLLDTLHRNHSLLDVQFGKQISGSTKHAMKEAFQARRDTIDASHQEDHEDIEAIRSVYRK